MSQRPYIIAELSHNHNGDFSRAIDMVEAAAECGADAVKIQVRCLPDDVPEWQRETTKEVPWTGKVLPYVEYRKLCEYTDEQIGQLAEYARSLGLSFGASVWGHGSLARLMPLGTDFVKLPSAAATDHALIEAAGGAAWMAGVPLLLSTGGCDRTMVRHAVESVPMGVDIWVAQCTSTYPCPEESAQIEVVRTLIDGAASGEFWPVPRIGFSNHCPGIRACVGAVALGADWIEVHFTLDRSLPGTDQASSIEPSGLRQLREWADSVSRMRGDGEKRIQPGEEEIMRKLRRVS